MLIENIAYQICYFHVSQLLQGRPAPELRQMRNYVCCEVIARPNKHQKFQLLVRNDDFVNVMNIWRGWGN